MNIFNFSYRKVGGLHFVKLGRFGCSFYVSRTHRAPVTEPASVTPCICADGWPCPEYRSNNPTPHHVRHPASL